MTNQYEEAMRKLLLTLLLHFAFIGISYADAPFAVERFDTWGGGGLTVTTTLNNHYYTIGEGKTPLRVYDVIRSVNGVSAASLTEEEFYTLFRESKSLQLDVVRKEKGTNRLFRVNCRAVEGVWEIDQLSLKGGAAAWWAIRSENKPNGEWVHVPASCDFFEKNTYDFDESGPMDESIRKFLEERMALLGFVRDRVAPDLVISIVTDRNQRLEAAYRPLTREERRNAPQGCWFGSRYRDMLRENPYLQQVLSEQTQGCYFELTLLDGRSLADDSEQAPILWQYRYTDSQFPSSEQQLQILQQTMEFPVAGVVQASWADLFTGLEFQEETSADGKEKSYRVAMVVPGSMAAEMGFRKGDLLGSFTTVSVDNLWWGAKTKLLSEKIPIHKKYYNGDTFKGYQFYYVTKFNGKYVVQDFADEYVRHLLTTSGRFNYQKALYLRSKNSSYGEQKHLEHRSFSINFHEKGEYEVLRDGQRITLSGQLFPTRYRLKLTPEQMIAALLKTK